MRSPLREQFFETPMRVERIIHIDTMLAESVSGDVREIFEDNEWLCKQIGLGEFEGREEFEEMVCWADELTGWLVEIATPAAPAAKKTGTTTIVYSWGHYEARWFYAATYDDALASAMAWARERWGS